jgi:hypothetical protein
MIIYTFFENRVYEVGWEKSHHLPPAPSKKSFTTDYPSRLGALSLFMSELFVEVREVIPFLPFLITSVPFL